MWLSRGASRSNILEAIRREHWRAALLLQPLAVPHQHCPSGWRSRREISDIDDERLLVPVVEHRCRHRGHRWYGCVQADAFKVPGHEYRPRGASWSSPRPRSSLASVDSGIRIESQIHYYYLSDLFNHMIREDPESLHSRGDSCVIDELTENESSFMENIPHKSQPP